MNTECSIALSSRCAQGTVEQKSPSSASSFSVAGANKEDGCSDSRNSSLTDQSNQQRHRYGIMNGSATDNQKVDSKYLFRARKLSLGSNVLLNEKDENSSDVFTSGLNEPDQRLNQSTPSYSLQRFVSEPGRRLGRTRWQSESILEIDTSEDVVGGDGCALSRSARGSDSPRSVGQMPTWTPSSLRYIKVNLNQGRFQSWLTTSTPRASPQSPSITTEASSTIGSSDTVTPRGNPHAFDQRVKPLSERGFPTSDREVAYGNFNSGIDQRFRSDSVFYQPYSSSCNPIINTRSMLYLDGPRSSNTSLESRLQLSGGTGSYRGEMPLGKGRTQSLLDLHEQRSSMHSYQYEGSRIVPAAHNYHIEEKHLPLRSKELNGSKVNLIDQQISHNVLSTQNNNQVPGFPGSSEKNQTYIVRSTLCYNTSTQTDLIPHTANKIDPPKVTHRKRQVSEVEDLANMYQTPPNLTETFGKLLHDKSVQTADSEDFNNSTLDAGYNHHLPEISEMDEDFSRSSFTVRHTLPTSPYRQTTHAQHASNELLNSSYYKPEVKYGDPILGETASNHLKLVKEMYVSSPDLASRSRTSAQYRHASPRLGYTNPDSPFKSGTPKAEYNNSQDSHLAQSNTIYSQDGFRTSTSGFRHDISSAFSDPAFRDKTYGCTMNYNNPNRFYCPKEKQQILSHSMPSSTDPSGHHRETSSPFLNSATGIRSFSPESAENIHDLSWTSGLGSEASSIYTYAKSSTSDLTPSRSISVASNVATSSHFTDSAVSPSRNSKDKTYQWKKVIILNPDGGGRSCQDTDSVFIDSNESDSYSVQDVDLNKTLSSSSNFRYPDNFNRNSYQSNISNVNKYDDRHSGLSPIRRTSGHNAASSFKFRDRVFSDSQTLEQNNQKRSGQSYGGSRAPLSESLADVISMVNENLAKSAQRVCGIRRSSSSISGNVLDRVDTSHQEKSRRETDWTRLRGMSQSGDSNYSDWWSSRRSLDSESIMGDISMLTSSTLRSSFAESRDRRFVPQSLGGQGMHGGVVVTPDYQPFPSTRRPPPQTPQPPRPSAAQPPAIPPRMSRQNQQPPGEGTPAVPHPTNKFPESSMNQGSSPREKTRIHVIPLGKQNDEDSRVDSSKVNFKDLIMQWNNTSPGENSHSEEFQKRPTKFQDNTHNLKQQQQQPPKNMPPVISHPKPNISSTATNKQEPMLVQDLSALSSSTLPTSSSSSPITLPASSSGSSTLAPTSLPQPSNGNHPSNSFESSDQHSSLTPSCDASPTNSSYSIGNSLSTHRINNSSVLPSTSNIHFANIAKPNPKERASTLERPRIRSSSQMLLNYSPETEGPAFYEESSDRQHPMRRERSTSYSDILSDKIQNSQPPNYLKQRFWVPPNGIVQTSSSQHPKETVQNSVAVKSPSRNLQTGQGNSHYNAGVSNPLLENHGCQPVPKTKGISDDNHTGSTNNSSRDVDTVQRSIPTRGSHSGSNDIRKIVVDADSMLRQESKLGQQSWGSESVLSLSSTPPKPPAGLANENAKTQNVKGNLDINTTKTPVRPPRPSVQGRHAMGQTLASSKSSTADAFKTGNCSATHTPNQPILQSNLPTQEASNSVNLTNVPNEGVHVNNISQTQPSPQKRLPSNDILGSKNSLLPQSTHNYTASSSSENSTPNSPASSKLSSNIESALPSRYHPSSSLRSGVSSNSVEDLTRAPEVSTFSPRRKSYSNASSTPRGKSSSFSFSKRQPSMEELDCDEKARQLAVELEGRDRRLLEALRQDANTNRMLYMDGLFSESVQAEVSQSLIARNQTLPHSTARNSSHVSENFLSNTLPRDYQTSSKTEPETDVSIDTTYVQGSSKLTNENSDLQKHKEELVDKLNKKLKVLRGEKAALQLEVAENSLLGEQVTQVAHTKCPTENEREKFRTHLDDLEKIVRLLLNLSGQLARAENAVTLLSPDADVKVKKLTLDKRERLHAKHEEAKLLKEDIDKRSDQLLVMLQGWFSENELADYSQLIRAKSTLLIQLQELEDEIVLAEHQVVALRRSLPGPGVV